VGRFRQANRSLRPALWPGQNLLMGPPWGIEPQTYSLGAVASQQVSGHLRCCALTCVNTPPMPFVSLCCLPTFGAETGQFPVSDPGRWARAAVGETWPTGH
jgi:hypothetical protein